MKRTSSPLTFRVVSMLIGCLAFLLVSSTATADDRPRNHRNIIIVNNNKVSYGETSDFPFDLKYEGIVTLSNDDKMITGISPNGFVEINKTAFGNNRRLYIHADQKGTLSYDYYVGKSKTNFEPEGKKWLAEILPDIVKRSELGIESRVRHIYNTEGFRGFMNLIENLPASTSSHTTSWSFFSVETHTVTRRASTNTYFKTLIFDNRLKNEDLIEVIEEIESIRSNSTKGTLLRHILENYKLNDAQLTALLSATATHDYNTERGSTLRLVNKQYKDEFGIRKNYFDIIDDMEINSEKGNVLKDLMATQTLSNDSWIRLLESVDDFSSEREKGAVLLMAIPHLPANEQVMGHFRHVLDNMSSHYHILKGEITNALLDSQLKSNTSKTEKHSLVTYLKTANGISSNSQRGLILRRANKLFINDPEVIEAYFDVMSGMDSEMEKYNVMLDLLNRNKLEDEAMNALLKECMRIVSDYQHGTGAVLRQVIKQFPLSTYNYDQFFQVIGRMDQNSTIEELLRLIIARPELNDQLIVKVIEATQQIDVDIEKSALMVRLTPHLPAKNSSVTYIFKSLTKDLESEYEKNRVLKTLR